MSPSTPVIVIGGGIAGLCTALAAGPRPVLLLCRGAMGAGSSSALAQGGIAAALAPGDRIDDHVADTLSAGAWRNDPDRVRMLAAAAPESIRWLQSQGVDFDRVGGILQLGLEGGHGVARIVHAGGDATGAEVTAALWALVRASAHIECRSGVEVDGLLLHDGVVAGVRVDDGNRHARLFSSDVVLATGGIGALFAHTSNPTGADGAGLALTMAAGVPTRDLEFLQFHPTALDVGRGSHPLVTEALRGAGARLLDASGRPVMEGVHPQGDLAPRDVVARRVWQARRDTGAVFLDARIAGIDWPRAFPTVLAACLAQGIDPRSMPIPVTAAAHFHMGGLVTDETGRTRLPGLYAVGEVACTGVHGGNRLASNSLLECVVFGRRLGAHLARADRPVQNRAGVSLITRGTSLTETELQSLREILWQAAGPVRTAQGLLEGLAAIEPLVARGWQARLGRSLLRAAYRRRASVGAHWRADAPACQAPGNVIPGSPYQ